MYRILLVDDERPALQFLNTIVTHHLPDFEVAGLAEDAEGALQILAEQSVDVLVTDVSMPGGMNGIDLSKAAREKYPDIRIVIVSGYAEFEYARGAMQVGAEDYLLKPISIARVKEVLQNIKASLDDEHVPLLQRVFFDLLNERSPKQEQLERAFDSLPYHFALVRFGNLNGNRHARLTSIGPDNLSRPEWLCFFGRDEDERIVLHPDTGHGGSFSAGLTARIQTRADGRCWTAVCSASSASLRQLAPFLKKAVKQMNESLVIGCTQCLSFGASAPPSSAPLPVRVRRQLSGCIMSSSWRMIQELFLSLAVEWEAAHLPQEQVEQLCYQLVSQTFDDAHADVHRNRQELLQETAALFDDASSVGELLSSLYEVLFGDLSLHDKQISGDELCAYTLNYIRQNYNKPLNTMSICAKTGFSQTYLSRLLRKYANTSVNAYLTQCRLEAAKHLLQENPEMLLRNVASLVGYEDQSYFNKIFRKEIGMTPRQYANQFVK